MTSCAFDAGSAPLPPQPHFGPSTSIPMATALNSVQLVMLCYAVLLFKLLLFLDIQGQNSTYGSSIYEAQVLIGKYWETMNTSDHDITHKHAFVCSAVSFDPDYGNRSTNAYNKVM